MLGIGARSMSDQYWGNFSQPIHSHHHFGEDAPKTPHINTQHIHDTGMPQCPSRPTQLTVASATKGQKQRTNLDSCTHGSDSLIYLYIPIYARNTFTTENTHKKIAAVEQGSHAGRVRVTVGASPNLKKPFCQGDRVG